MANLLNATRMIQLSLGMLSLLLLAVAIQLAAQALPYIDRHFDHFGSLILIQGLMLPAIALIGAAGAILALKHADQRSVLAATCARTGAWVAIVFGALTTVFMGLSAAGSHIALPLALHTITLGALPCLLVGWRGLSGPKALRDAGLIGLGGSGLLLAGTALSGQWGTQWMGTGLGGLLLMGMVALAGAVSVRLELTRHSLKTEGAG